MPQFRNLVFEGGGVKGIAYAGALRELETQGVMADIKRVAGTSAGAITAVLVALGAAAKDVEHIVGGTDFSSFMDGPWGVIGDANRVVNDYGVYAGDAFANWMKKQVYAFSGDPNLTFRQMAAMKQFKELHLVGTNLSLQLPLFSRSSTLPIVLCGMPPVYR